MDILDWAKKEVEIAIAREKAGAEKEGNYEFLDYSIACYQSALKAFKSLCEDEHSGMSISITKHLLNWLIDGKPLTPIEDTDDIWRFSSVSRDEDQGHHTYQCTRMSSLFKDVYPNGRVTYHDVNRVKMSIINSSNPEIYWHSGLTSRLIDKMYPITMPYCPENKPYIVKCSEGLFDPENGGDFDTIAVWSVTLPDGSEELIHKFYKEPEFPMINVPWEEIDEEEFREREAVWNAR